MKAWRIVLKEFGRTRRDAFSGLSGFATDGRWHSHGRHLDYAAESLSLAILERVVHYKRFDELAPHAVYVVEVPDSAVAPLRQPPKGWDGVEPLPAAQALGNAWCDGADSPGLLVPSAVTPGERNLMLNTRHPKWKWDWVIAGPTPFAFDPRLLELMTKPRQR